MLSIVIPTFNSQSFISDALESAITASQRLQPAEIIVQDDASVDDTLAVIAEVAARCGTQPLLQVNRTNLGPAGNRNKAIGRASGDFVLMLDADNILDEESAVQLAEEAVGMDRRFVAAAFSEMRTFRHSAGDSYSWIMTCSEVSLLDAVRDLTMPAVSSGNLIFRRSAWEACGGYPEFAKSWDTHLFALRLLTLGDALVVPGTLYHHRRRDGSNFLSNSDNHRYAAFVKVLPELHRNLDARTRTLAERVHSSIDVHNFLNAVSDLDTSRRLWYSTKEASVPARPSPRSVYRRFATGITSKVCRLRKIDPRH